MSKRSHEAPASGATQEAKPPADPGRVAAHHLDAGHHHGHAQLPHWRFLEEIKRRNVGRVAILYIVVSYVVLEVFEMFFHLLEMPAWSGRLAVLIAVIGFPIALLLAWAYEITPEGLKPTDEVPPRKSITRQTGQRLDRAIAIVLAIALSYFVVDKFWLSKHTSADKPVAAMSSVAETPIAASTRAVNSLAFTPPAHSIAVLPFVNMSGDPSQEYFSDGLTEELLNSLSRINELQVVARTSAFSFKGTDADIQTIARKLNVGAILEGSVRRSSHAVRITAQLINGASGFHIWSQTYDRKLGDVLALQADIATAVANALKIALLQDTAKKILLGGTANPAAFDAFLRGNKLGFAASGVENVQAVIAAYTEAIRLDPYFAMAYVERSVELNNYARYNARGPAIRASFDGALADARTAVSLKPDLAEAHYALALALETGFQQFAQAEEELERSLALAPGNARILSAYSRIAATFGHESEAVSAARRADTLDPLNFHQHRTTGIVFILTHRYADAVDAFRAAISLQPGWVPDYALLGQAQYLLGQFESSRASCEAALNEEMGQFCLAMVYWKLGRRPEAEAIVSKLKSSFGDDIALDFADIYTQWGDIPTALHWLETAARNRDSDLFELRVNPLLDPLRNEPRFQAIERNLKFPN